MIPYYSPNFYLKDLLASLFRPNSQREVEEYFRQYSGKKHILFTASCRSALYLAYNALDKRGSVITSPLTCRSALDPIVWSGNRMLFADVDLNTLNHSESAILGLLDQKPIAIQVINHGGIAYDTKRLKERIQEPCIVIEDCAQAFGAERNGFPAGYYADVACYSLIKNAYGIGGGILATNNLSIYENAKKEQAEFPAFPLLIASYRLIKNTLESYRQKKIVNSVLSNLVSVRRSGDKNDPESKTKFLKKPHRLFSTTFAHQLKKIQKLHKQRSSLGVFFIEKLRENRLISNYNGLDLSASSFTKLFVYNPSFNSGKVISSICQKGIEAKHLEQKADSSVQPLINTIYSSEKYEGLETCENYIKINEMIVSLPLYEKMRTRDINTIIDNLKECLKI